MDDGPRRDGRRRRVGAALAFTFTLAALAAAATAQEPDPEAPPGVPAAGPYPALIGAEVDGLDGWLAGLREAGQRPAVLQVHEAAGARRYTGWAVPNPDRLAWELTRDRGAEPFRRTLRDSTGRGFRLAGLAVVPVAAGLGLQPEFVSTWVLGLDRERAWFCYVDQPRGTLQQQLRDQRERGLRPRMIGAYRDNAQRLYAALWIAATDREWVELVDVPARALPDRLAQARAAGYRPVHLAGALDARARGASFSGVLVREVPARPWSFAWDRSATQLAEEHARRTGAGAEPILLVGYPDGRVHRYAGAWLEPLPPEGLSRPISGRAVPALEPIERALRRFLDERSIPAATLAVARGGKLLLERGFGWLDRDGTRPVPPQTPMRLASLSKPITAAAIRRLAAQGKLDLDAKVVDLLDASPPEGRTRDPRWERITVAHLLDHRGGWDREATFDPAFRALEIARELKLATPPGPAEIVRSMAGQPLQFEPGERSCYSNFGYTLLGRVVERASGRPYGDYVREEVLAPLGVTTAALGRTRPADRDPAEPFYSDPAVGPSVFDPEANAQVPMPDGGFALEAMDSHGGWIASAGDYARFLAAYHNDGRPARGHGRGWIEEVFGRLPGTWTVAFRRPDGTVIVALCNQRSDDSGLPYEPLRESLDRAAGEVAEWPVKGEPLVRASGP